MLRTIDGRVEWVDGRRRKPSGAAPEVAAVAVGLIVLLALVL